MSVQLSKAISYILRHNPLEFGIVLDDSGSCTIDELLAALNAQVKWKNVSVYDVENVVKTCDKQRFEIQQGKIRARYGHSNVKVRRDDSTPPEYLFHGTATQFMKSILEGGIKRMNRDFVHLSETTQFASLAGNRHGKLVLLKVDTKKATENGVRFYYAGNEVWLSTDVPSDCFVLFE